jgi:hypothetical protein
LLPNLCPLLPLQRHGLTDASLECGDDAQTHREATMTRLEMIEAALKELGDAEPEKLIAFVRSKYKVEIEPKFIPLFKASLRDKAWLEQSRAARATGVQPGMLPVADLDEPE